MQEVLHQILAGLATGGIYACVALALVMIYQATQHSNFAQGEMAMFSTFVAWMLINQGLPYWAAFAITVALSFVMAMNYLAVMVCPFIVDLFRHLFGTHSDRFPFFFNAALVLALTLVTFRRRDDFILGLDESYYKN